MLQVLNNLFFLSRQILTKSRTKSDLMRHDRLTKTASFLRLFVPSRDVALKLYLRNAHRTWRKRTTKRPKLRWKDNIKTDLTKIWYENADWIQAPQGRPCGGVWEQVDIYLGLLKGEVFLSSCPHCRLLTTYGDSSFRVIGHTRNWRDVRFSWR